MADEEFLVDVSFNVDEAGASSATSAVEGLENIVQQLGQILMQTAQYIQQFFAQMESGSNAATETASALRDVSESAGNLANATQSADELAASQQQAAESANELAASQEQTAQSAEEFATSGEQASSSADNLASSENEAAQAAAQLAQHQTSAGRAAEASSPQFDRAAESAKKMAQVNKSNGNSLKQIESRFKKLTGTIRKFIGVAAAYLVGSSLSQAISNIEKINEKLADTAKALKTTTEGARAHEIALSVMGKTYEEIQKSKALTQTYNDLKAIGQQLALPEGANGLKTIQNLKDGLMQLKFVGNYALQWLYYKIQTVAAGPLNDLRNMVTSAKDWLAGNIDKITTGIAKAFGWVVQGATSVIKFVQKILSVIDKLPPSIKTVGAVALAVIAAIKSKMALISLIIGAIVLLIDDLITYMEGGESALGGFWGPMLDYINKIKPVLQDIVNTFDRIITKIKTAWQDSSGFLDFIKRLALGDDYEPDASWETVGQKIWEKIKSGFKTVKGWIFALLFPDGVPDDIGGGDWSKLANKILAKITEGIKAITGIGGAVIEGAGNMAIDLATALLDSITNTLANTKLEGITSAVTGLVQRLLTAITNVFSPGNLTKISSSIKNLISGIFTAVGGIIGDIGTSGVLTDMGQTIVNLVSAIFDAASSLLQDFKVGDLLDGVQKLVEGLFSAISNMFSEQNIGKVTGSISGFISSLLGAITNAIKDLAGRANLVTDAGNAIVDLVSGLLGGLGDTLGNLELGDVTSAVGTLVNNLLTSIGNIFSKENIGKVADNLKKFVSNLFKAIGDAISGALDGIGSLNGFDIGSGAADIVTNLLDAIFKTVDNLASDPNVTGFVEKLGAGLVSALGTLGEIVGSFAGKIVSWIFSGDAIETIFNAGKNIIGLLIKGIEAGISGIFSFAFNVIDGILEGLGILDPETKQAYEKALQAAEDYKKAVSDAFADGFYWDEGDIDVGDVNNAIMQALALKMTGGELDETALHDLALSIKDKISEYLGYEISEDAAGYHFEGIIDGVVSNLSEAASNARVDGSAFSGMDVKKILGPFLEQFGAGAESISAEMYDQMATYLLEGGLDNEKNLMATLFAALFDPEGLKESGEEAKNEAKEAAKELGIETKEAAQEGYQEGLNSGEPGTSTVDVGNVEVTGNDAVTAKKDVNVEAGEVNTEAVGDAVKSGAVSEIEKVTPEVAEKAEAMANEAAAKYAAVLNTDAGKTMGTEFISGLVSGLNETSEVDTAVSTIAGKFPSISESMGKVKSKIDEYVKQIASKIKEIPATVTISASLSGANEVERLAGAIKKALEAIPRTITVKATVSKEFGFGGVVSTRTEATIGEDGKEYIIPVTKPARAADLLKRAAADIGMTVNSTKDAAAMLGGSGAEMKTPEYATSQTTNNSIVNNYNNVSAPATFNVRGTDARAIADNVNRNHESVILRNIKSAIA